MRGQAVTFNPFQNDDLQFLRKFFEDDDTLDFGNTPASPSDSISHQTASGRLTMGLNNDASVTGLVICDQSAIGTNWSLPTVADPHVFIQANPLDVTQSMYFGWHSPDSGGQFVTLSGGFFLKPNNGIVTFQGNNVKFIMNDNAGAALPEIELQDTGVTKGKLDIFSTATEFRINAVDDYDLALRRDSVTKILLDTPGNILLTPTDTISITEDVASPFFQHDAQATDAATTDFTIQSQSAFASAVTNVTGGDLIFEGGSGVGSTTENNGHIVSNNSSLQLFRTMDWGEIASVTSYNDAVIWVSTDTAGTDAARRIQTLFEMKAGYTGAEFTEVLGFDNVVSGTNSLYFQDLGTFGFRVGGNRGIGGFARGVTTGTNVGGMMLASNGDVNYGSLNGATVNKTNAVNVGSLGVGWNASAGGTEIGVYALLKNDATAPNFSKSAALYVDNGTTTSDIATFRDNDTEVVAIEDGGNLVVKSGVRYAITEITAATYTLLSTDYYVSYQRTNTGTGTITLPAISAANHGQEYTVKDADGNAGTNNVTFNTTGGDTIDNAASGVPKLTVNNQSYTFVANNTTSNWEIK